MTPNLRSVEEVADLIDGTCVKWSFDSLTTPHYEEIKEILTTDRQSIAAVLIAGLEGMKEPNVGKENKPFHHRTRHNKALDTAIALIKATLDVTSEEK